MKYIYSFAFKIQALSISLVLTLSLAFLSIYTRNYKEANTENLVAVSVQTMHYLSTDILRELSPSINAVEAAAGIVREVPREHLGGIFKGMMISNPSTYDVYYGSAKSRWEGGFFEDGSGWKPYEDPNEATWNHAERPWFIEAVQNNGKVIITEPYIDAETNRLVFTAAKTAETAKGQFNGVVAADVFLDVLDSIVRARKITEDGESYLLDAKGVYLTSKNKEKIMKNNFFDDLGKDFSKEQVLTGKNNIFFSKKDYLAVSPLKGTDWFVVSKGSLEILDKSSIFSVLMVIVVVMIMAVAVSTFFASLISRRISSVKRAIDTITSGDISKRLNERHKDEIGDISRHLNKFLNILCNFMRSVDDSVLILNKSSTDLNSVSGKLIQSSTNTVHQTALVASSADLVANNISDIAAGMERTSSNAKDAANTAEVMSTNIITVASAIEKMGSSINQIASSAGETASVAEQASKKALQATETMSKLGEAANQIGQVTDIIKKIADKTNLLALNATIEAASAGEAGKGFAVVANEIKELANQSAHSADDIANKIESIQSETKSAVEVISNVSEIIHKINESVEVIAGHVDQQTKASIEIANNAAQAGAGAKKVADTVQSMANGIVGISSNANKIFDEAKEVSKSIYSVNQITNEVKQDTHVVMDSSTNLSAVSDDLKDLLRKFSV
jgi:methyl-accepting chemotaxis protein